jgi:hypothetical protein
MSASKPPDTIETSEPSNKRKQALHLQIGQRPRLSTNRSIRQGRILNAIANLPRRALTEPAFLSPEPTDQNRKRAPSHAKIQRPTTPTPW